MAVYGMEWLSQERTYRLVESFGLEHLPQVVCLPRPPEIEGAPGAALVLRDLKSGEYAPAQIARHEPECWYALLHLAPWQTRLLEPVRAPEQLPGIPFAFARPDEYARGVILGNGRFELLLPQLPTTEAAGPVPESFARGPLAGFRLTGEGAWRGRSFFDAPYALLEMWTEILESGPVRAAACVTARFAGGGRYTVCFTVDAGADYARVDEEFRVHESAQVVIDLCGPGLPDTAYFLDCTPGYDERELTYDIDHELARLGGWSQQMQLAYSDGFAFGRKGGGKGDALVFGAFAIDGGHWRGNRLNTLDAWVRRWRGDDPLTRRLLPAEAKADAPAENGEQIPARDRGECTGHLSLEGWLGGGSRSWGLLLCREADFTLPARQRHPALHTEPENPVDEPLGHFEHSRHRESYQAQQGLLRRLHIRHGVLPLQAQFAFASDWCDPQVVPGQGVPAIVSPLQRAHLQHVLADALGADGEDIADVPAAVERMQTYLRARVETFWYGAGIVSTNPVSSRAVAPLMFFFEHARERGWLEPELQTRLRAWFSLLAGLFASPTYYPGDYTMLPPADPESYDPGLMGMANQNFFTDVYNVPGTAAEVFPGHPQAMQWRAYFSRQLARQLAVHVYPKSGVWEESHTYYQHVLHTLLPLLLRRRAAGMEDAFADAPLRRMVAAALHQVTPPDAAHGGLRHLVPFGDHGGDPLIYTHLWLALADGVARYDSALAAAFSWMARETGTRLPPDAPAPRPLPWTDEYLAGLGVFLRTGDARGGDELFALRTGSAWAHHHNDDGSFWLYSLGRMLIGDSAHGEVQSEGMKTSADGHSRWTPGGGAVQNHLWRFNRGHVCSRGLEGAIAWTVIFTPARLAPSCQPQGALLPRSVRHWRAVVRLGAGVYLLLDRTEEPVDTEVHFHLGAPVVREENGCWRGEYPDNVWLELRPLWEGGVERLAGANLPANGAERFRTHHLMFTCPPGVSEIGYLLSFGPGGASAPALAEEGAGCWNIRCEADAYRLQVSAAGDYLLRSSAEEVRLRLGC